MLVVVHDRLVCSADGARIVVRTRDQKKGGQKKKRMIGDERLPCCVIRTEISAEILARGGGGGGGGPSKNGPFPRPVASAGVSGGGELRFDQSWSL